MRLLLYIVFVLSGAAGLIYESIWTRYLGLFVGHSAYAQVIVLVIFLGGMSAGAYVAGRRTERLRDPLLWYAGIELVVGTLGLFFHEVFNAATALAYDRLFPVLPAGLAVTVAKWLLASLLILPQSVLLGATFPLMSAGVLRRAPGAPGRVLSLLYFANSAGAAVGVLLAGFWLLALAGLPGTLLVAAMTNLVVALAMVIAVRVSERNVARTSGVGAGGPPREESAAAPPPYPHPIAAPATAALPLPALQRLLLLVSFGTAIASFIYEIAWIRMLSLVLGSATHSFELMLSAFILGLALGAFWVRRRADTGGDSLRTLAVVQWTMGFLAVATLPLYMASFGWTATLLGALGRTEGGYVAFTIARYVICLVIMLPATFCAGMTLPLITRSLLVGGAGERAIGAVYAVNTLGSIVGAAAAALILLPLVGLKSLLILGAVIDMGLSVLLFLRAPHAREPRSLSGLALRGAFGPDASMRAAAVAITVLLVAGTAWQVRFDRGVLTSGVYRYGTKTGPGSRRVAFYEDGRTATVSVRRGAGDFSDASLATNGKPDASLTRDWFLPMDSIRSPRPLGADGATQTLLPLVTLAHAPSARTAAVIGHGSGMTSHFLLGDPKLREVVTIEIEPEMIQASRVFYPINRRVFDDPRGTFRIEDAKAYFAAAQRRFDVIISEPSNPWVSGVSGLFTDEFYHRVKRYLTDGGVFGQWLHLYEIDDPLVMSVISAVHRNFASYEIFLVSGVDILIVASDRPVTTTPDWTIFDSPAIASDLARFVHMEPEQLDAMRLANKVTLAPLIALEHSTPNSDYYPRLDLGTERTRFLRSRAVGLAGLGTGRFDVVAALEGQRRAFGTLPVAPLPDIARCKVLASGARLRQSLAMGRDTLWRDEDAAQALYIVQRFASTLVGNRPPADWKQWVIDAVAVESALHAGTAGVADENFYRTVRGYLARTSPPAEVTHAIEYLHGIAVWDWAAAVQHAEPLIERAREKDDWLPPTLLRDGAATAHLRLGHPADARAVFYRLAPRIERNDADLRARVLWSHIRAAEAQP